VVQWHFPGWQGPQIQLQHLQQILSQLLLQQQALQSATAAFMGQQQLQLQQFPGLGVANAVGVPGSPQFLLEMRMQQQQQIAVLLFLLLGAQQHQLQQAANVAVEMGAFPKKSAVAKKKPTGTKTKPVDAKLQQLANKMRLWLRTHGPVVRHISLSLSQLKRNPWTNKNRLLKSWFFS